MKGGNKILEGVDGGICTASKFVNTNLADGLTLTARSSEGVYLYERVGSNASSECDVRIIAATHRNLEESIVRGTFRGDLFYRLNVFPIEMPTLATRIDDLPALIADFTAHAASRGRPRLQLMPETLSALAGYSWPETRPTSCRPPAPRA